MFQQKRKIFTPQNFVPLRYPYSCGLATPQQALNSLFAHIIHVYLKCSVVKLKASTSKVYTLYTLSWIYNMTLACESHERHGENALFCWSKLSVPSRAFSTFWLVERWLTLWWWPWNRIRFYSSVTLTLATLCWRQRHIVNPPLCIISTITLICRHIQ